MPLPASLSRDRAASLLAVAAIHALLAWALIAGLGVRVVTHPLGALKIFDLRQPPPPPPLREPVQRPRERAKAHEGAAAPPNLKSKATPVVAPPPQLRMPVPPPLVAAPRPALGSEASSGAALVPGEGTGSGGIGSGRGSGSQGSGEGDDGGDDAELVRGDIGGRDYPRAPFLAGIGGTVYFRMAVGTDGRVSNCTVTRSSGNAELDETTCRLVLKRFRFRPATDSSGRPVPDEATGEQHWDPRRAGTPPH